MKRFLIGLFLLLSASSVYAGTVTVDSIVSADDVTIAWLNGFKNTVVDALNSFPGDNIEDGTITSDALDDNTNPEVRWGEAFSEFVYSGLLPPTSASLTSVTTAGVAYVKNDTTGKMTRVEKDATSHTYTASKDTYVDISSNGTFTYSEVANGAAQPVTAANSIRLAKVVSGAATVSSVTDLRVLGIQLATDEDFYKKGLDVVYGSITTVSVDPGIVYSGATRVEEVSITGLDVSLAADYLTGASERGASKVLYIYISSDGVIKLDDNAPDYHDTDGNTAGVLYYYKYNSAYYRCLGYVYLNAAQEIVPNHVTSLALGDKLIQTIVTEDGELKLDTTHIPLDNTIPQITEGTEFMNVTIVPSSIKSKLKITVFLNGGNNADETWCIALFQDAVADALAATKVYTGLTRSSSSGFSHWMTSGTMSPITFRVRAGGGTGTVAFNGDHAGAAYYGHRSASSISIEEYSQ